MKKLILCSVLLLCMLAGSTASMASDKIHVVFIGNSITYGATLSSPSTEAPPVITGQQLYKRTRVATRVKNCGVSGITTFGFLPGRSAYNTAVAAAAEFAQEQGPLYFSIMLGTNDSAEKGPEGAPVSTDTYKNNLKSIIDSLKAKFPQAKFILNYPIWYSPTTHNGATYLQAGLDRLNSYHPVIDNIVSEYSSSDPGKVYAGSKDAYSFFENNTQYFTSEEGNSGTFYLHPNAQGAVKLAGFWTDAIMQVLATDGIDEYTGSDETWLKGDDLITDTLQITSNTMESWKFSPANLIRPQLEGYSTGQYIYHSAWTDPLPQNESPYLQVHLKEAQSDIFFMMISSEWAATYDTPRDVVVMATNTPDDEDSWQEVCELQDLVTEIQHPVIYYSPHIALGGEYTDLRFVVKATVNNRKSSTGSLLLSLGRFQVIKAEKADTPYRKLLMLLDEMSEKGMDYQSGTQPGYYSEQAVNNLIEAYEAANYAASQSLSDEEYASAEQNLRNAYNAVEASLVKITDGYYYIVSAYPAFAENNVGTKAMYVSGSETLRWATLDEDNPGYLFKITMSDDSICNIQSVYSGRYVNTLASQFTDAPATMQLIKRIGTTPQFTIANVSNTTPYHCQDHKEGAGTEGVICAWSGKADTPSAWYLVAQNDAEKISALEQEGEQAYRSDRVLAAVKSTRDSRLKADDYEPYITDGSQITANSMESSQFTPANLIRPESDGYGTSQYIFHTSWSSPLAANEYPWLQVSLNSPLSSFRFKMISSEWEGTFDTPSSMDILATNTPDDEDSWTVVKQLTGMVSEITHPVKYMSDIISLESEYSNLRFVVKSTVNNRTTSTGMFYLSLGRFQVYGVTPLAISEYYTVEGMKDACDNYDNIVAAAVAKATAGTASLEDAEAIYAAAAEIDRLYVDRDSIYEVYAALLDEAESAYDKAVPTLQPLITDGSQITANSVESSQFTPANLIRPESDGYGTGQYIFHTSWSSPLAADVMPYLQVHLSSPESSFIFKMISSEWAATFDTPNSMSILATNTPDDEDSWVNVKQLDNMIPDDQKFSHPTKYTSAMIDMAGEYSDVRFVVNSTVNNRLASTGIFYLSLGRFQMYTGVDPETVQYNYNPEVTAAADTLKSLIDAGAAKTVNNLTAGDITALRTAIDNLNNAYADTTSLAAYYRKMMTRAENFTVGEEIGEADSEESVAAFLSALQTAHALVNSRQPMKADIAKAIEGITEAYDTMLEHVNKLQAGKWYYIVSECSSDYCSGKAMMATSADYGSQVHFGQNDNGENDPAYIENPFAMWRFMPVEGTPYYSIQNLATSHSVAATSGKGVSIQRTPAPYRVDYIGAAELQFVPVGEGNAEEYQLNAQANDTLVVLQNAELGGASSWTVVPVEDDAYLKFPIAANSIGIMTLPFDIPAGSGSVMQMNPNVTTYSVKSVEVSESLYSSVIALTKTEEIKAGVPFVIVEGNTSDYSQNLPMSSIYTTLPADVDTTSRKANALVGTLGGTVLSAGGYGYFANNAVEISGVGQVEIPGMSGWIDAGNAVCEDGNADLVINVGGIINSISDLTKEFVANGKTKVYTIDGVYVGDYSGFAARRAKGQLPKGIYIVSGRKVMVK